MKGRRVRPRICRAFSVAAVGLRHAGVAWGWLVEEKTGK